MKLHYAFLLETVFINFIKKVSWKTGGGSLPVNLFLSLLADLKEAQCKKDTEREKSGKARMFWYIIITFISHEYITEVFESIFLAVISFSNKTLMH